MLSPILQCAAPNERQVIDSLPSPSAGYSMKKSLQFCVFAALSSLQVFASQSHPSQFSVPTLKQKAALQARLAAHAQGRSLATPGNVAPANGFAAPSNASVKSTNSKTRSYTGNPPIGKMGFVTATQVAAGGGSFYPAIAADFNGDGKQDVATLVGTSYNYGASRWNLSISVVLSNGNGTFQAAQLTPNPNGNAGDEILVADLNGDGKQDVIVIHTQSPATFDVFLGNGNGTFTLANTNPYTISPNPLNAGVLSDVNGDGKPDLVVVDNQTPANLSVLLGNGDGTFQPASSLGLSGGQLTNLVFADFNGDGLLDFAATDSNSNYQTVVYLAQANGGYVAGSPLITADHVYGTCSTAAGDLNNDGKPEIVTVNCDSNTDDLTVYVNNGDGTFQTGIYYAPAQDSGSGTAADIYPLGVTIADVNGDGKNDIVSSNADSSDVTVLLGNGDGTVRVPNVGYSTGGGPEYAAIVGDFNGDGLADVIVPDGEYSLVYLQGYGDGSFRAALDYFAAIPDDYGASSAAIASGDFNGDGYPDFVLGNEGYNPNSASSVGITVFLSRSDGSLAPGVNYGSGGNLVGVAVADFDGDKIPDIAAVDYMNNTVLIFHGKGDGTFTQTASYVSGGSDSWLVIPGDFNQDGHIDLAVANWDSQDVSVLLNDGTGAFLPAVAYPVNGYPGDIVEGDVNGDGTLDLAVSESYPGIVAVLLGNPDGTFQGASTPAFAYNYLGNVALGDVDGDGILDLAVAVDDWTIGTGVAVAKGNGDGTFQAPSFYTTTLQNLSLNEPYPGDVKLVDLDGDGDLDLVYTNVEFGTVGILFNTGTSPFAAAMFYDPVEYPGGNYPYAMNLADVNQDGAIDVVVAGDDFAGATVLLNNSGSGTQPNFALTSNTMSATVTAGNSGSYNLSVTGSYGYAGTVTFACAGLPAQAACAFTPASVVANGHLALPSTLTVTTTAAVAASVRPARPTQPVFASALWMSLGGLGFGIMIVGGGKKRRSLGSLGILLLLMTFTLLGCGGSSASSTPVVGGSSGTPAGSYTVTVTATGTGSTAINHALNLTLIVQ